MSYGESDEEGFAAQEVYCPECEDNYWFAWSNEHETMYVVCGCAEAEPVDSFLDRFREEHATQHDDKMFR